MGNLSNIYCKIVSFYSFSCVIGTLCSVKRVSFYFIFVRGLPSQCGLELHFSCLKTNLEHIRETSFVLFFVFFFFFEFRFLNFFFFFFFICVHVSICVSLLVLIELGTNLVAHDKLCSTIS